MNRPLGGLVAGLLLSICGLAQSQAAPRVVLAVDGVEQTRNLPVLVAQQLGYFRDEGLTVTLVDAPAQPNPAALMKDGRADGAVAFYHHTFMSQTDDQMVTVDVATLGVTPGLKLMVATRLRDRVKGPEDLKGLRIYTGGVNSGKTTAMTWLAQRAGFGAHGYTPLAPTTARDMAAALRDGRADAVMTHEPDAAAYARSGAAFELVDLASPKGTRAALGALYPSTALYMPKAFVDAHPEVVQHLVDACLRALAYIDGHSAEQILAVLPPKMGGADKAAFARTLAEDKTMFETSGLMPEAGAGAELAAMAARTPRYRQVDLAETYTDRFVRASPVRLAGR